VRIGFTYDLKDDYLALGLAEHQVAEFDSASTIEAIARALTELGHEVERVGHVRALAARLVAGWRCDLVFNIAEGVAGFGRESQIPALLEAYEIPYTFSDPLTLALSLHKGMAKRVVRDAGIPTPDFAVVERPGDVNQIRMPFPVFVKPVAEGSSKGVSGVSMVLNATELAAGCLMLLDRYRQPVLVEEFLPGREFTVGIAGTGPEAAALGVMEIHLREEAEGAAYTRANKTMYEGRVAYTLVEDDKRDEAIDVALAAWRALGCRDAGRVDLRCDSRGAVNFLEVNPLAGLHPTHSDLVILCRLKGIGYQRLIETIVSLACDRVSGQNGSRRAARARTTGQPAQKVANDATRSSGS